MDKVKLPRLVAWLTRYYVILQSLHLVFLARAGIIFSSSGRIPFPAQPPLGGWTAEVIPYLLGMGAVDGIAALLALYAGFLFFKNGDYKFYLWAISLTLALSSAVVYCAGTLPSGAWQDNPLGYGLVAAAFSPLLAFYLVFLPFWVRSEAK